MTNETVAREKLETISARELRRILFLITDEEMTIRELRYRLYLVGQQDEQVEVGFGMEYKFNLR
jgi:hypothetical protein